MKNINGWVYPLVFVLLVPVMADAHIHDFNLGINRSNIDAAGPSQPVGFMLGWGTELQDNEYFNLEFELNLASRHTKMLNKFTESYTGAISFNMNLRTVTFVGF